MTSRLSVFTALLLAVTPLSSAQAPPAISIMTGPPGTAAAANPAATTISVGVSGGNGTSRTNTTIPGQTGAGQRVWVVQAGSANGTNIFSPDTITGAAVGDVIQFQFWPNNHSVAAGDYANPCQPMANSANAFFSGFVPTTAQGQETFSVTVKDTNPMWFYCTQGRHCQAGMVGVVNPPTTGETLTDFKQRAAQAANNVAPSASTGGTPGAGTTTAPNGVLPVGPTNTPVTPQPVNSAQAERASYHWAAIFAIALSCWIL